MDVSLIWPRKVGMIPAKADVEEQDRFKKRSGAAIAGGAGESIGPNR